MKEVINVNVLLCREYNPVTQNIMGIFNRIKTDSRHNISFTLFTALSERGNTKCYEGKFTLHFFIVTMGKSRKKLSYYLGAIQEELQGDDKEGGAANVVGSIKVDTLHFLQEGEYQVQVFFSDRLYDETFAEYKKKRKEIMIEENLISKYDLKVEF